jgi:KTSC domain
MLCCAWICQQTSVCAAGPEPAAKAVRIERAPVESSGLVSIGFAPKARVLEIEFRSGAIYRYLGVPPTVFEAFKKAESKGRYFAQSIRGKYEFQRVEIPAK